MAWSCAGQGRILNGIFKEVVVRAGLGLAIGVACGWWSSRLFESLLFGVKATDPATYLTALAMVGGVALIASVLPAIRAARNFSISWNATVPPAQISRQRRATGWSQ